MAAKDRISDELGPASLPRDFSSMPRKDQLPALMGPRLRWWGVWEAALQAAHTRTALALTEETLGRPKARIEVPD